MGGPARRRGGRLPGLRPPHGRGGRRHRPLRRLRYHPELIVAKLVYTAITSLDGYIEDEEGKFDWAAPDEEVHAFINDLERPIATYLVGRRLYDTMAVWETLESDHPEMRDYAEIWRSADKIVYSRTLDAPSSERTRIEREFDPEAVRQMTAAAERDISVGGSELAGQAIKAGLVDECHLFISPVVVGGGKRALPDDVRWQLELLDERRFGNAVVHVHYRSVWPFSSIQSARDTASSSPPALCSAAPAWRLRPSSATGQETIVCGSPARTGASTRTARRASTIGRNSSTPGSFATGTLVGQSSAAQTISLGRVPSSPASAASGVHGAANTSRCATGPEKIRSPSPGVRLGPHTKHVGKGCMSTSRNGESTAASVASPASTGDGASAATEVGRASATTESPSRSTAPSPLGSTSSGRPIGGGSRSVTSAASASRNRASRPHV